MEQKRKKENVDLHRKPHFFKVLLGDFACQLKLPPNFLKHISNEPLEIAILLAPNGCKWPVDIKTTSDGTYFTTGWSNFVTYHSLKEREFLVFEYRGNLHFSIQVFDTTACEREDLFDLPPYNKSNIDFCRDESNVKKNIGNVPIRIAKTKSKKRKFINGIKYSQNCLAVREESLRASEAAKSFRSEFPSVVVHMTASKVESEAGICSMRLPMCFSRKHLPREKTIMSLIDPNEKAWTVTYRPGKKDGRDALGRGWIDLVRANNMEHGDHCVFELKAPTLLKVHIFRANSTDVD